MFQHGTPTKHQHTNMTNAVYHDQDNPDTHIITGKHTSQQATGGTFGDTLHQSIKKRTWSCPRPFTISRPSVLLYSGSLLPVFKSLSKRSLPCPWCVCVCMCLCESEGTNGKFGG